MNSRTSRRLSARHSARGSSFRTRMARSPTDSAPRTSAWMLSPIIQTCDRRNRQWPRSRTRQALSHSGSGRDRRESKRIRPAGRGLRETETLKLSQPKNCRTSRRLSARRSARGSSFRTRMARSPTDSAPRTSAWILSPIIQTSSGSSNELRADRKAPGCGFSNPVSAEFTIRWINGSSPRPLTRKGNSGTWLERIVWVHPSSRSSPRTSIVSSYSFHSSISVYTDRTLPARFLARSEESPHRANASSKTGWTPPHQSSAVRSGEFG